jgi:hypothetical protein
MSSWISLYLAGYVTFTLWSLSDDAKNKNLKPLLVATEIAGDVYLVLAGLTFWLPQLKLNLEPFLVPLFGAGVIALAVQMALALRRNVLADQELSFQGKLFVGVSGSFLSIAASAPLLYWGFNAALLNRVGT